ncbi:conserved exported hypothetical protein [Nitrosomonas nitrosa]|uniref:Glycine-zipper containing OmpA-like membrane domain-containing protein n=1 Tax=Nitrosomonas nitrosa TaxID=52442 RepID=A0A8H8YYD8_9PROT|nr:hypothetical protein [Nitrosomonas nitrosa]CAE6497514.1 conserved exported hypothetical protein [Nitrosomonas nitrosa]
MTKLLRLLPLPATLLLAACASIPTGPGVMALPGSAKSFQEFRDDDRLCRQYAYTQIGGKLPGQAATASGVESAAVGAGTGFLAGGLAGTELAHASGFIAQQRYDMHYIQCMYAQGHRVPVAGTVMQDSNAVRDNTNSLKPSSGFIPPPPPPGNPPPPPPQ